MEWNQTEILAWFAQYAYEPNTIYLAVVTLLLLSSFGLPIPEEIILLGAGIVIYIGRHPELFPAPSLDAVRVQAIPTAIICFLAVFLSDLIVFLLGKFFGTQVLDSKGVQRFLKPEKLEKIEKKVNYYGMWACALFRFTPGIRFSGHLMCGSLDIPLWKFIVADGIAALLTVPTQVILVAWYGDTILTYLKQFKIAIGTIIILTILGWLVRKILTRYNISRFNLKATVNKFIKIFS